MKKIFICLAKSAREGGFCVAGKEILIIDSHIKKVFNWFRPVGVTADAIPCGDFPFLIGDVVSCEVESAKLELTQSENFILCNDAKWEKIGHISTRNVEKTCQLFEDRPDSLWGFGDSSRNGINDKISEVSASQYNASLYFVKAKNPIVYKRDQSYFPEETKAKIRLKFYYNNINYDLIVTDPSFTENYWNTLSVGEEMILDDFYITVSLAKPYKGYCYKLVAGHVCM